MCDADALEAFLSSMLALLEGAGVVRREFASLSQPDQKNCGAFAFLNRSSGVRSAMS